MRYDCVHLVPAHRGVSILVGSPIGVFVRPNPVRALHRECGQRTNVASLIIRTVMHMSIRGRPHKRGRAVASFQDGRPANRRRVAKDACRVCAISHVYNLAPFENCAGGPPGGGHPGTRVSRPPADGPTDECRARDCRRELPARPPRDTLLPACHGCASWFARGPREQGRHPSLCRPRRLLDAFGIRGKSCYRCTQQAHIRRCEAGGGGGGTSTACGGCSPCASGGRRAGIGYSQCAGGEAPPGDCVGGIGRVKGKAVTRAPPRGRDQGKGPATVVAAAGRTTSELATHAQRGGGLFPPRRGGRGARRGVCGSQRHAIGALARPAPYAGGCFFGREKSLAARRARRDRERRDDCRIHV
jgi:hypothetical protein